MPLSIHSILKISDFDLMTIRDARDSDGTVLPPPVSASEAMPNVPIPMGYVAGGSKPLQKKAPI